MYEFLTKHQKAGAQQQKGPDAQNLNHLRERAEENRIEEQERQLQENYTRKLSPPTTHGQCTGAMTPRANQQQHQQDMVIPVYDNYNSPARNG